MKGLGKRIARLAAVPRLAAPPPRAAFDPGRLTPEEQAELDGLLRPLAPLPGEGWDLKPLTTGQLERAHALVAKGHGIVTEGPA